MVRLGCPEVSQNPELARECFQGSNLQGDMFVVPSSATQLSIVRVSYICLQ